MPARELAFQKKRSAMEATILPLYRLPLNIHREEGSPAVLIEGEDLATEMKMRSTTKVFDNFLSGCNI